MEITNTPIDDLISSQLFTQADGATRTKAIDAYLKSPDFNSLEASTKKAELYKLKDHYAKTHNIDPEIFGNLIGAESSYNTNATSPTGARGLTQLTKIGTKEASNILGRNINREEIGSNLEGGAALFASYLKQAKGDVSKALEYYLKGPWATEKRIASGLSIEKDAQNYIQKIRKGSKARTLAEAPEEVVALARDTSQSLPTYLPRIKKETREGPYKIGLSRKLSEVLPFSVGDIGEEEEEENTIPSIETNILLSPKKEASPIIPIRTPLVPTGETKKYTGTTTEYGPPPSEAPNWENIRIPTPIDVGKNLLSKLGSPNAGNALKIASSLSPVTAGIGNIAGQMISNPLASPPADIKEALASQIVSFIPGANTLSKGALMGTISTAISKLIGEGEIPSWRDLITGAGFGALVGKVASLLSKAPPKNIPLLEDLTSIPPTRKPPSIPQLESRATRIAPMDFPIPPSRQIENKNSTIYGKDTGPSTIYGDYKEPPQIPTPKYLREDKLKELKTRGKELLDAPSNYGEFDFKASLVKPKRNKGPSIPPTKGERGKFTSPRDIIPPPFKGRDLIKEIHTKAMGERDYIPQLSSIKEKLAKAEWQAKNNYENKGYKVPDNLANIIKNFKKELKAH